MKSENKMSSGREEKHDREKKEDRRTHAVNMRDARSS